MGDDVNWMPDLEWHDFERSQAGDRKRSPFRLLVRLHRIFWRHGIPEAIFALSDRLGAVFSPTILWGQPRLFNAPVVSRLEMESAYQTLRRFASRLVSPPVSRIIVPSLESLPRLYHQRGSATDEMVWIYRVGTDLGSIIRKAFHAAGRNRFSTLDEDGRRAVHQDFLGSANDEQPVQAIIIKSRSNTLSHSRSSYTYHASSFRIVPYRLRDCGMIMALLWAIPLLYPRGADWLARTLGEAEMGRAVCRIATIDGDPAAVSIEKPKGLYVKLCSLWVSPQFRGGNKVGVNLVASRVDSWTVKGFQYAYLTVNIGPRSIATADSVVEVAALSKVGFRPVEVLPERYGRGRNELVMGMRLGSVISEREQGIGI
jgi:hypothetical protein